MSFDVVRRGAKVNLKITVADLEALQPSSLIELGDSVLHNVSIQRARAMNLPQAGVVLSKSGYEFSRGGLPRGALIVSVNGNRVETVEDLLSNVPVAGEKQDWRLRYIGEGQCKVVWCTIVRSAGQR